MKKLFHRNFVLLIMGQVSSLFANIMLRFALSMYILELTGSAAVFAGLLAVAMIPTVLLSPLGGILADRANRRNIMVALDFLSGVTALVTFFFITESRAVAVVGCVLVVLSILGAFESPTVQAAVPQMQEGENIIRANAAVNQVAALAALVAPFLGSACYAAFGLKPVVAVSAVCFFLTALLEAFIRLPFTRTVSTENWSKVVKEDFQISIRFITKENPRILKMLLAVSLISFFIIGIGNVGLPYLIRSALGLNAKYAGIAESVCGAAAILGSVIVGLAVKRLHARDMYKFLLGTGIFMLPMGIAFLQERVMAIYLTLLLSIACIQILSSIFSIYCMSLIQQQTPNELLGKVMAYTATISLCMQPLGQIAYGVLFDRLKNHVEWIMFGSGLAVALLSLLSRKAFVESGLAGKQIPPFSAEDSCTQSESC